MESYSNNSDFERLLREQADQYRMLPSEKVWRGIQATVHTRRRWYGLGLVLLLLFTVTAVTLVMLSYPVDRNLGTTTAFVNHDNPVSPDNGEANPRQFISLSTQTDPVTAPPVVRKTWDLGGETPVAAFETAPKRPTLSIAEATLIATAQTIISRARQLVHQPAQQEAPVATLAIQPVSAPQAIVRTITPRRVINPPATLTPEIPVLVTDQRDPAEQADLVLQEQPAVATKTPATWADDRSLLPTIESVISTFQRDRNARKVQWQLYFTPSISYRKLSENKSYNPESFDPNTIPQAAQPNDVNAAVTHKPDLGLELGVAARYPISSKIKLRGALQFNVNRYDIKAFAYSGDMVNIDVSNGSGNNVVSTWTYYSNYSGYRSDWLKNFYLSVSAPIGLEYRLLGTERKHLGVIGTVQPTYVISDRAYLISSDYKNYAEVPWLIRRLNFNTSFEVFAGFNTGNTRWQVGPQIRYQMLSSFQNKYPVKENLFDFGLKVGISLIDP